jgi:hypothetical protein
VENGQSATLTGSFSTKPFSYTLSDSLGCGFSGRDEDDCHESGCLRRYCVRSMRGRNCDRFAKLLNRELA